MTREEQAKKRKQEILEAALELFIHKGYYGTSTRQISQKAGISSGLMFHYFVDKDALYCALITSAVERMKLSGGNTTEDPDTYLSRVVATVLTLLEKDIFFAKLFIFIYQAQHTEGIPEEAKRMLTAGNLLRVCAAVIRKGQEMGQFKEGDAEVLGTLFLCAIQGIAMEKVRMPERPLPKADWIMDMIRRRS